MGVSDQRKEWQAFKKKYPGFEKAKAFKANFGPQLDKLVKADDDHMSDLKKLIKRFEEEKKAFLSLCAASEAYLVIAVTLEEEGGANKGILEDFKNYIKNFYDCEDSLKVTLKRLKKVLY